MSCRWPDCNCGTSPSAQDICKNDVPVVASDALVEITGRNPAALATAVSNAIHNALSRGMEPDEAISVALHVLADYGRTYYGDEYIGRLAGMLREVAKRPIVGEVTWPTASP